MKKLYDDNGKATVLTHDYFVAEWHRFREIMCSTEYDPDQKHDAYGGLLRVYFLCDDGSKEDWEQRESMIALLQMEFPKRMGLELTIRLETLFNEQLEETVT